MRQLPAIKEVKPLRLLTLILVLTACKSTTPESGTTATNTVKKLPNANGKPIPPPARGFAPTRIAFGSCSHEGKKQPILNKVVERNPDLFIYLGDNIYGDTRDMGLLQKKYDKLARKKEFQNLCNNAYILATWDDHDYGENDAGRHYPKKRESKEIFLNFWGEPAESYRWKHEGIYTSHLFQDNGHTLQIILLDTRTFRDKLLPRIKGWKNDYRPNSKGDSTFLGARQWAWLEEEFKKPAELRIIASSNQFAHEYNGWESWTNVPRERERMLTLIKKTKASGVMFISGDVHWGEMSVLQTEDMYPITDVTSSGLTQTWPNTEPNSNRMGDVVRENNFGLIEIDWEDAPEPEVTLQLINLEGESKVKEVITLSAISF